MPFTGERSIDNKKKKPTAPRHSKSPYCMSQTDADHDFSNATPKMKIAIRQNLNFPLSTHNSKIETLKVESNKKKTYLLPK